MWILGKVRALHHWAALCMEVCCSQPQSWQELEHEHARVVPNTVGPRKRRMTHAKNPAEHPNLLAWFMTPPWSRHHWRPHLTFWQRQGHIPPWIYLGLTNHLSSLQSYHLPKYRWDICICGQKPGPGVISPELAPSVRGQSASRNPTANFPRTTGPMGNVPVFPSITFSQDSWTATNTV